MNMRRWWAACTAVLLALLSMGQPAFARPQDGIMRGSGFNYSGHSGWYGAYHLGDLTAYCADLNSRGPSHASGWTKLPESSRIYKQTGWGKGEGPYPTSGPALSQREEAELSYALYHYGRGSTSQLRGVAMEHFVRVRTIAGSEQVNREKVRWETLALKAVPGAKAEFERISAQARKYSGPFKVELDWTQKPTKVGEQGTAKLRLVSGSGVGVPGAKIDISTYKLDVLQKAERTNGAGEITVKVRANAAGEPQLSAWAKGLASARPVVWLPTNRSANVQRLVTASAATTANKLIRAKVVNPEKPETFTPEVSTRTSQQLVSGETQLTDAVMVSGGKPGAAFTGKTTLFGPFEKDPSRSHTDLKGAPVVGVSTFKGTFDKAGKASVTSSPQTVSKSGFYVWSEQLDGSKDWESTPPAPPRESETSVHVNPSISTKVNAQKVKPGATLVDTVTVTGIVDQVGGKKVTNTVTATLYGPVTGRGGSCEAVDWKEAPVASKIPAFEVTSDQSVYEGVGEFVVPDDASTGDCYTYAETLTVTAKDEKQIVVTHAPGHVTQTALVERDLFTPEVSTRTSQQLVSGETQLTDAVMVSGGKPGAAFTGKTTLFGPFEKDPSRSHTDLKGAPVVGVSTFKGTFDKAGKASVTSSPQTVSKSGFYVWSEQLDGSKDWESTPPAPPRESETSVHVNPSISTKVNAQKVKPGATLVDTVTVTGIVDQVGGKKVTNMVGGEMLGPVAPVNGSCEAVDWTNAPVARAVEPFEVTSDQSVYEGVGEFVVPEDPSAQGCYTYTETLTVSVDGEESVHVVHEPGQAEQTALVSAPTGGAAASSGGDTVVTGDVPSSDGGGWGVRVAAGVVGLLALGGAGMVIVRRRSAEQ